MPDDKLLLETVFTVSGVPTHTFVEPVRYDAIKVSIRTPGRCVVVEGPSGIGKTTTIARILEELGKRDEFLSLSARRPNDVEMIEQLPTMADIGTVIIDDFHVLSDATKSKIADFVKVLADTSDSKSKLVLIGINKAGDQLVRFAHDVGMRIDIFKVEANPVDKIEQLISLGEKALGITISDKPNIAAKAQGSFHIAQFLCHNLCLEAGITESVSDAKTVDFSAEVAVERVMSDLHRIFSQPCIAFARGSKIRREGRAPYLHILKWLSEAQDWSLDLDEAIRAHPDQKGSITQVIEKGYFELLLRDKAAELGAYFHYDVSTRVLSVEDPKIIFYLRNLVWSQFSRNVGFSSDYFRGAYDIALSFAGPDRPIAKQLYDLLVQREIVVFYDENEQHRIIARDIEDYLAPIYRSEAAYVVPLLSAAYPTRIWTKFESEHFKERFGSGAVIAIRYTNTADGYFSDAQKYGTLPFDPAGDVPKQLDSIVDTIAKRLAEDRQDRPSKVEADGQTEIDWSNGLVEK